MREAVEFYNELSLNPTRHGHLVMLHVLPSSHAVSPDARHARARPLLVLARINARQALDTGARGASARGRDAVVEAALHERIHNGGLSLIDEHQILYLVIVVRAQHVEPGGPVGMRRGRQREQPCGGTAVVRMGKGRRAGAHGAEVGVVAVEAGEPDQLIRACDIPRYLPTTPK